MDLSILLKVLCCCIILVKADVCVQRSPCRCVFPNGTGIDLAQSATTPVFISAELKHYERPFSFIKQTYFFHPCYDVMIHKPDEVESCPGNWSICRYYEQFTYTDYPRVYTKNISAYEPMGTVRYSHFASDEKGLYINYPWPLSTKVYLYCFDEDDKLLVRRWSPEAVSPKVLEFVSRNACLKQLETVSELSISRWMEMQWIKVSKAVKDGYTHVVDGLKWLVPQPLERIPSFLGRT